jgi:hypothetical protein
VTLKRSYDSGNKKPDTREIKFQGTISEVKRRGGRLINSIKEGNKRTITFESPNGNFYNLTIRPKNGTWQTTENLSESEYWMYADIGLLPPKLYITSAWWVIYNIWEVHSEYLRRNG